MNIAIVGSSVSGQAAAHHLSADRRHSVTVLERVERLDARGDRVDVWVDGVRETFDAVVVATSAWEASALLGPEQTYNTCITLDLDPREAILLDADARIYAHGSITTVVEPGEGRCVSLAALPGSTRPQDIIGELIDLLGLEHDPLAVHVEPAMPDEPLTRRVYFADSAEGAGHSAYNAVARMADDHAEIRQPSDRELLPAPVAPRRQVTSPRPGGLTRLAGRLSALVAAPVELIDLSGQAWPVGADMLYVANRHSIFDSPRVTHLKGLDVTLTAARDAALESLSTNTPIIPIAAYGSDLVWPATRPRPLARLRRQKLVIVIGEPFHPETSSVDELLGDIRAILLHLEELARAHAGEIATSAHALAR
jgi:hypothetical protein